MKFPKYVKHLIEKKCRYKVLYGGRGSGKSYAIADALLIIGVQRKIRVLCAREFQNSISESVLYLLKQEIDRLGLNDEYDVTPNTITGKNGTEFIFKGIRMNVDSIKSMAGITHVWLEEAHNISQTSWNVLIPTIREPGSEIWVSFNPDSQDDPTYTMFVEKEGQPKERADSFIMNVNWQNNPFFPEVLKLEKNALYESNADLADHVWGGKCRSNSDAQIFKGKWRIREFEPQAHFDGPYFGADFGFSNDPSTLVRMFLDLGAKEILIRNAAFGVGVEIDDLPEFYDGVPDSRRYKIRADCARPETISHLARKGFNIEAAKKWSGSVEDGVEWLRSWTIVIHPECDRMIDEAKNYSFKVDRLTNDVTTLIVDAYNHGWDAVRYGLEPLISAGDLGILDVL